MTTCDLLMLSNEAKFETTSTQVGELRGFTFCLLVAGGLLVHETLVDQGYACAE
jgi:hypothetical protein